METYQEKEKKKEEKRSNGLQEFDKQGVILYSTTTTLSTCDRCICVSCAAPALPIAATAMLWGIVYSGQQYSDTLMPWL